MVVVSRHRRVAYSATAIAVEMEVYLKEEAMSPLAGILNGLTWDAALECTTYEESHT